MASASSFLYEEQLLCSICLDAFTEPVTTPCGHNYCKSCITGYWTRTDLIQCPLCKKKFRRRPQLQVNTEFRDMVEHFNNMRVRGGDDILAKPGEVPCDICLEPKLKAQKTCLVCLASYCQTHLEPHQRVTNLKKHQLIDPSNLEDRVCKKHDKTLEFFCHFDQMCVCSTCLKEEHAMHGTAPLEQVFKDKKCQLDYVISHIKMTENAKSENIKAIKHAVERSNKESKEEIAVIVDVFTALVVPLISRRAKLIEVIQEKQKATEKEAEDCVTQLEQEIAELRRRRSEMEKHLQTEDHLLFLQSCPSLFFPVNTIVYDALTQSPQLIELSAISQQNYVGTVKKAVAQMEKMLSKEMERLIEEVRSSDGCEADEWPKVEVWTPPQDKLMMIQQCNAVNVTLDAYTAHPRLMVSENGKQLRFHEGQPSLTTLFGRRFQHHTLILGKEGFSSGRFYYEVRVSGSKGWLLGVVKESVNRELFWYPTPADGGWTVGAIYNDVEEKCFANSTFSAPLSLSQRPQTVGVFVDYEKGEVSFYDVDTRTLIYSYTGCSFIENVPALKAFLYYLAGTSVSGRQKLYPFFGIFEDNSDNMLEITLL
ncbi:E3 ubiquitin-protein ligase TRIM17-like [Plectropomus leopardus]|uniref:E3 ubiquitin-protein ligase TRIM17-like n=1 Tax=Plectropomus leopardus TaxID=160734 RepID=UPI001C4C2D0E|nr:E3 ubiquitin-protein ligase TRIM17-like [Plectropomus leopardus]